MRLSHLGTQNEFFVFKKKAAASSCLFVFDLPCPQFGSRSHLRWLHLSWSRASHHNVLTCYVNNANLTTVLTLQYTKQGTLWPPVKVTCMSYLPFIIVQFILETVTRDDTTCLAILLLANDPKTFVYIPLDTTIPSLTDPTDSLVGSWVYLYYYDCLLTVADS